MSDHHYLTYAFPIASPRAGWGNTAGWNKTTGILAAILPELRAYDRRKVSDTLTIVAERCDSPPAPDQPVQILAPGAEPCAQANVDRSAVWFDQLWATFHPSAFTAPALAEDVLRELFVHEYAEPLGSLAQLSEHYQAWGPLQRSPSATGTFADRFAPLFRDLPAGAIVHWNDFFFAELILRIAPRLSARGVFQTYHHHLSLPSSLLAFPYGERVLRAMSLVDRVYLHTDKFANQLGAYLARIPGRRPEVKRFDLGPDCESLRTAATPTAMARPVPQPVLRRLGPRQRELVRDAESSRWRVAHRFVCMDRLDPIKGSHIVLDASERFLESQARSGADLPGSYRFYFMMDGLDPAAAFDPRNVRDRYARYVRSVIVPRLVSRFPGVVFACGHISDRALVARLLVDANVLAGGVEEGLNLVVQESLYVNHLARTGRTAVVGDGAGFAMQARAAGFGSCAEYPKAASASEFAEAIGRVTATSRNEHRSRTTQLAEGFVARRRALMCPPRDG